MDISYDKYLYYIEGDISYNVNFYPEPETGNIVITCVSCVWFIKKCDLLSMPMHFYQDVLIIIVLKPWLFFIEKVV